MRLAKVDRSHAFREKLVLGVIRVMSGSEPAGVVKTHLYRREFLGRQAGALTEEVMRGPSEWSVAERELFAAFVSSVNRCVF